MDGGHIDDIPTGRCHWDLSKAKKIKLCLGIPTDPIFCQFIFKAFFGFCYYKKSSFFFCWKQKWCLILKEIGLKKLTYPPYFLGAWILITWTQILWFFLCQIKISEIPKIRLSNQLIWYINNINFPHLTQKCSFQNFVLCGILKRKNQM